MSDVSEHLNPILRDAILRDVGESGIGEAFEEFRLTRLLRRAHYPVLPEHLWDTVLLEVEVPVLGENGEVELRYEKIEANHLTIETHGNTALPCLLEVDTPVLPDVQLARFTDYCLRWKEYLEALAEEYQGVISVAQQQRKELLGRLPGAAFDNVPRYKAEQAAKTDPYVIELERNLVHDEGVLRTLKRRITQIRERVAQNSREQSRRSDIGPVTTTSASARTSTPRGRTERPARPPARRTYR